LGGGSFAEQVREKKQGKKVKPHEGATLLLQIIGGGRDQSTDEWMKVIGSEGGLPLTRKGRGISNSND